MTVWSMYRGCRDFILNTASDIVAVGSSVLKNTGLGTVVVQAERTAETAAAALASVSALRVHLYGISTCSVWAYA